VTGVIRAICVRPEDEVFAQFKLTFRERGKARISLAATIEEQGITAVRFQGVFVALQ
jgi:thioesterase domain-containing protein